MVIRHQISHVPGANSTQACCSRIPAGGRVRRSVSSAPARIGVVSTCCVGIVFAGGKAASAVGGYRPNGTDAFLTCSVDASLLVNIGAILQSSGKDRKSTRLNSS